ncbi:methyl-accepting chemotaxis protein [Pengzhenrongella phosphoraccumulans]|uniref:methyl-accepting chemotaxis protein n=1 Tax=Pengzhenrongella phosphoraccumulans TaxID=3114394 RepID=UPI00388EE823
MFEQAPVAVLVVDAGGSILHRNHAAQGLGAKVLAERGGAVLQALQGELVSVIRDESTYPVTRIVSVEKDGRHAEVKALINRLDAGYVVVWSDDTAAADTARASNAVARELSSSSGALTALSDQIAAGAEDVSARAASVAAGSEQMSASIREIAVSAAAAATGTAAAVSLATLASQRLAKLGESSTRIGAVSKLISAIAEQTNLLALNATIEAARAGEAGKGFAVVANEVKELAGSTRTATAEITEMIGAIQADTTDAAGAIGDIVHLIGEIELQQSSVASAVEEQTAVASEMSASVTAVARGTEVSVGAVGTLRQSADFIASRATHLIDLFTGS